MNRNPNATATAWVGYVFPTQQAAQAAESRVNAQLGYPRAGVNVGGGIFASVAEGTTQSYMAPIQHPTSGQWAFISDPTTDPILVGTPGLPTPALLDPTWFAPPAAVTPPVSLLSRRTVLAATLAAAAAGIVAAAALTSSAPSTARSSPDAGELDSGDGG